MDLLHDLARGVLDFAADNLYVALFVLLSIEEAGVPLPLPGDTLILLAGSRASAGQANPWVAMTLVVCATLAGSSVLYWVSRLGGMPVLRRVAVWTRLGESRIERAARWYRQWTAPAIVFGRLVPGFRTPTTAVSGTFRVPYPAFLVYTAISATLWSGLYLSIGALAQDAYSALGERLAGPGPAALLLLAFGAAAAAVGLRRLRRAGAVADDGS
jgi:membrane protein DedA with SNARE-associated domain